MQPKILFLAIILAAGTVSAQTAATRFNAVGPDSTEFYLQKGLTEKQNGRRLESLKAFEKAATYDASNKTLMAELALAYLDLRRYGQARDMYKKMVEQGDNTPATYKQLLTLSYQLKQHEDVLFYADKLKAADASEKVLFYVGKAHFDMDNYGDAIKYLNGAAKEDPTNPDIPYMIAKGYADMMNFKLAVPYFQKAIELKPAEAYWVYELGLVFYAMNNDKEALKYMLEAGQKGMKRDNDYLENLGIAYLNVGNLDEGVNILSEILKRRPSDLNILNMVAEAYYYKGKYDKAIEYWDKVLEYDKGSAASVYMIGMAYQKKGGGDKEKGVALCDKAIEMDPSLSNLKKKISMPGM